jgi:hypothetical protein
MWTINKHAGLRKLVQCHLPQCVWKGESLWQWLRHRRTLSKQSLWGQVNVKLTPEICINNASSYSRLTSAGRRATAADSHSQSCLQTLFFSSLPLMRQQPNYTCMLKNLLKLYCIWTWDTLWCFFVCLFSVVLVFFFFWFFSPLMRQWQNYFWGTISRIGGWKTNTKIIETETLLHLNLEIFFFIYLFIIIFFQSSLCLSNACSVYCWLVHYLYLFISLKLFVCFVFSTSLFICFSLFL